MFTGLIEQTGRLIRRSDHQLVIHPERRLEDAEIGESIAVNGCCLSLERQTAAGELEFHTLEESLRRTNLGVLAIGSTVNLERAMPCGRRFGGHLVQGHIDGTSRVLALRQQPDGDWELAVELPAELAPEVVLKGSIAIDGVSLTVARLESTLLAVRLIPLTLNSTALKSRRAGEPVNLETDIIGKYVRRQLDLRSGDAPDKRSSGITMEKLREAGFC